MYCRTKWGIVFEDWIMHTEVTGTVILLLKWPSYFWTCAHIEKIWKIWIHCCYYSKILTIPYYWVMCRKDANRMANYRSWTDLLKVCSGCSLFAQTCLSMNLWWLQNEPPHDKTNKMTVRPAKTQISLGIRVFAVCSMAKDPSFLNADSEDSNQTGQMPRLIWDFAGRSDFVGFVMRRLKYIWLTLNRELFLWLLYNHANNFVFQIFYMFTTDTMSF